MSELPDELRRTLDHIAAPEGRKIRRVSVRNLKELEGLGVIECTGYTSERDRRKARKRRRRR